MTRVRLSISAVFFTMLLFNNNACRSTAESGSDSGSELQSEVDSYTPHALNFDPVGSRKALERLDEITRIYLQEAVAWANRQPSCDGMCMALLVSESLAASVAPEKVEQKLAEMRAGKPFSRWTYPPEIPGWRGYQGAIEPLLSRGKTTDGRFTMSEGLIHLTLADSVFQKINRLDSPGSFVEVGAILPFEVPSDKRRLFIGSDKFGHFLSTGYEYLEAYQETFAETLKEGLSKDDADERALFATLVRGALTEVTSLGGWIARVFSFGDLSANFDGFLFFKEISDNRSPYFSRTADGQKWQLTSRIFTWQDLIQVGWDEGQNCSHYFASVSGQNHFAQKIVAELVALNKHYGRDFVCPIETDACRSISLAYAKKFGAENRRALISPQCVEYAEGKRNKVQLVAEDAKKNREGLDALGFYSGETISQMMKSWCVQQREALVAKRCENLQSSYSSTSECVAKVKRVSSERFRCQMDLKDFGGWAL